MSKENKRYSEEFKLSSTTSRSGKTASSISKKSRSCAKNSKMAPSPMTTRGSNHDLFVIADVETLGIIATTVGNFVPTLGIFAMTTGMKNANCSVTHHT